MRSNSGCCCRRQRRGAPGFVLRAPRAKNGAPSRSRTCNLQIRSLMLYPVELWARRRTVKKKALAGNCKREVAGGRRRVYLPIGGGSKVARVSRPVSWRSWVRRPMPRNWGPCEMPMPPRMTDNPEMRPAPNLSRPNRAGGRRVLSQGLRPLPTPARKAANKVCLYPACRACLR